MAEETVFSQEMERKKQLKREYTAIALAAVLFVVALIGRFVYESYLLVQPTSENSSQTQTIPLSDARLRDRERAKALVGEKVLTVEVVTAAASIEQGLSGRSEIGADGMLFILPLRQVPSFWMREMQFDLDMVWIDGDQVIGVTRDVPAPDPRTPLSELPLYKPPGLVTAVLELPVEKASEWGVVTGSEVLVIK